MLAGILASCGAGQSDIGTGLHIYRDGLLPSGEALQAVVAGDVVVRGTEFNCASCHGRSGMGGAEANYVVPPIAGPFLFAPSPQPSRPAYTKESLAKLLRDGVTPAGRQLDTLMPRFRISDADVASLAGYLATLSASDAPGVTDEVIRFAMVSTDEVDLAEHAAILAVLQQYASDKNRQTRGESERWDRGYAPESRLPSVFRRWVIDEWHLTGAPESWPAQLQGYYDSQPVFAMLSGLSTRDWAPIGAFCEQHALPCLFPAVDIASTGQDDFYTMYFSRGLALEADLLAWHFASDPVAGIIQVSCAAGASGTSALEAALKTSDVELQSYSVECEKEDIDEDLVAAVAQNPSHAVVYWTPTRLINPGLPVARIYVSSTLADGQYGAVDGYASAFALHPFRLPGGSDPALRRFTAWARARGVLVTHERLQAEAFFACLVLNDAVMHMGRFFNRDYVLDMLEHAQGLAAYLASYPRPTFGPRQRFVSKGGYVVPIVAGQLDSASAKWFTP